MTSEIKEITTNINYKLSLLIANPRLSVTCLKLLHNSLTHLSNELDIISSITLDPMPNVLKMNNNIIKQEDETPQDDSDDEDMDVNTIYDPRAYFSANDSKQVIIEKLNKVIGSSYDSKGIKLSKNQRIKRNRALRTFLASI